MMAVLIAVVALTAWPSTAAPQTPVRDRADEWIATYAATIADSQQAYRKARGRFLQTLATHSEPPSDGVEATPDRLAQRPTDQDERWSDLIALPAALPCALTIDVYEGPNGLGYVVTVRVRVKGQTFERRLNHGAETWRASTWRAVSIKE